MFGNDLFVDFVYWCFDFYGWKGKREKGVSRIMNLFIDMVIEYQEKLGFKLQSLRWFRYVFYLVNVYIRVFSLVDGKIFDRSVL